MTREDQIEIATQAITNYHAGDAIDDKSLAVATAELKHVIAFLEGLHPKYELAVQPLRSVLYDFEDFARSRKRR